MKTVKARITINLPATANDDQIREWVEFNLHIRASMSGNNPLADFDLECDSASIE